MIIPIRCFTCGKPIAQNWQKYLDELQKYYNSEDDKDIRKLKFDYKDNDETPEKKILDKLGYTRYCCRRMILSHIDLCEKI